MPHSATSGLGCLSMSHKKDARLIFFEWFCFQIPFHLIVIPATGTKECIKHSIVKKRTLDLLLFLDFFVMSRPEPSPLAI